MTKKDFALVAAAVAEVERINEDFPDALGIGASTLRLVVDSLASALAQDHPRFKRGLFESACLPIQNERLKQSIIKAFE